MLSTELNLIKEKSLSDKKVTVMKKLSFYFYKKKLIKSSKLGHGFNISKLSKSNKINVYIDNQLKKEGIKIYYKGNTRKCVW